MRENKEMKYYSGANCFIRPQWMLDNLRNITGKGVNVAVIDSGCDINITDDRRISKGISFIKNISGFYYEINQDYFDKIGHGTTCIDRILQIAPDVNIFPVKIFNDVLETSPKILFESINYVIEQNVNIINLSLSTKLDETLKPLYILCEKAKEKGIIIIASNSNTDEQSYPAVFDNVISVSSDRFTDVFNFSYAHDEYSECKADGYPQEALTLNLLRVKSGGNSFAAPVISAISALLFEKYGKLNLDEVRALLKKFAAGKTIGK